MKVVLNRLTLVLILVTLSAFYLTPARADLPEKFTAVYTLTKGSLVLGEMTRKLYPNGDGSYTYESHSKPIGYAKWFTQVTLTERSQWTYNGKQLRPLSYLYDRKGSERKKRHVQLNFDWQNNWVTNTINNKPWKMEIPDNTLDKLLYHLAVMHDLGAGREKLEYQVADGGKLKFYEFEVLGEETVTTDLGKYKTIKLKREGKRTTFLWCAIDKNYLPVRIEQEDKRGKLRMDITSLSGL